MSIDEAIKQLETYSIPCGKYKEAYDFAIDTMRKYKKIQEIMEHWVGTQCVEVDLQTLFKIREVIEDGE